MVITSSQENCSYSDPYLINESADSCLVFKLTLPTLVSVQSIQKNKIALISFINLELEKYGWLIYGMIGVELSWFLSSIDRQETDKSIDIDNLTKPIIDSLIGPRGIIIDDSQIKSIYTEWISKNDISKDHFLHIKIRFNNEETLNKENLVFIHYWKAMCVAINIDKASIRELLAVKVLISFKIKARKYFKPLLKYLLLSSGDFHRTRLSKFNSSIWSIKQLNNECLGNGLTYLRLLKEIRNAKLDNSLSALKD